MHKVALPQCLMKMTVLTHTSKTRLSQVLVCVTTKLSALPAEHAKASLNWLIELGVAFDQEADSDGNTRFHLTREGGHSHRRILHAADATGRAVQSTLTSQALNHPNIQVFEHYNAVDLITMKTPAGETRCLGAYVWSRLDGNVHTIGARFTALCTGGASKVYQYTSNPDVASGDGIAMAWRAGCRVAKHGV